MNFYQHAGTILDKLERRQGTIKGLVIGDPKVKDKKKMYALICETLKYKKVINELIDITDICTIEKKMLSSRSLAQVLIHDMLFTKRGIPLPATVPIKKCVHRHQARLKAELAKIKMKRGIKSNEELVSQKARDAVLIPRYARVNTHKSTMNKIIQAFKKEGYTFVDNAPEDLRQLTEKSFCRDPHLDDLLVFTPKTDLHNHPLYVAGDIILQDKASCFPAHVCRPPKDAHAIDACAAPGNKTSHLSALMQNTGRIWAFDLDARRLELLKRMTGKAGCKNISPVHGSFLEVDPMDPQYAKVEYFLLDPSCSGSGIVSRLDHLVDGDDEENQATDTVDERLKNLADFQMSVIRHALKFPNAKRVVYSTCSIHAQENEQVVQSILADNPDFALAPRESVLPTWNRRGLVSEFNGSVQDADAVVRTDPAHDLTNGFFVACFVRTSASPSSSANASAPNKKRKAATQEELTGSTSAITTTKQVDLPAEKKKSAIKVEKETTSSQEPPTVNTEIKLASTTAKTNKSSNNNNNSNNKRRKKNKVRTAVTQR
ncbi:S-adenosyl-L-methionine-dependent methyltransferase [Zychaea mexicana]|uniref:S-adenosyl-L-methionine-dependent methyltransferase n=1 Tax=Zychaea mexicana TaxID=64656 RepID=UPI0022FE7420|nr:S-adenosyl-L-methionine-dependent methyltransferase [Zychaea mexicana]KAI9490521.1 S-adenosyl-L-methionine-dependent methyltransferase [Zychaea mexicana]